MNAGREPPVLAVVTDLIFSSRIAAEARAIGRGLRIVRKISEISTACAESPPYLLLVDLNGTSPDPLEAIKIVRGIALTCEIVGFFSHVQGELAARALEAGASKVMPRSRFVQQLPELLRFGGRNQEQS